MNKLKGVMREHNVTQQELADILGISVQALNAKVNNRASFTIPEAQKISDYFRLENPSEIFFTHNIPNTQQK